MFSCRRFLCFTFLVLFVSLCGRAGMCGKHRFCGNGSCGSRVVAKPFLGKTVEIIGVFWGFSILVFCITWGRRGRNPLIKLLNWGRLGADPKSGVVYLASGP